jgi:signal recognition particle GTPase
MVKKNSLTLDNEFIQYCQLNNIDNVDKLANETFNRGFAILKYGETPNSNVTEKIVEVIKEVVVEKIVEVPVEVIREIIKEVPVEVIKEVKVKGKNTTKEIIKEVPITTIVPDVEKEKELNNQIDGLKKKNEELQLELDKLNNALNKLNKGTYMKNSDLSNLYDE